MPTDAESAPLPLPDRPNLRHLKDQARDLRREGKAASTTEAQFEIARLYGFPSWPKLKAQVESLEEVGQLKQAIDEENLDCIVELMTRNPELHRAPLGYGGDGPLTWVAECRVPWRPPSELRLAIARWMIENGSDVHQGGDGPLMRAALNRDRVAMMELLVSLGADVDAEWHGDGFPILFAPCESVDPVCLEWLLDHGADPNAVGRGRMTALDYLIGTYARSEELVRCIDALVAASGTSRYELPGVIEVLRGDVDGLTAALDADPGLIDRRYPELDCGSTGARRLLLEGATLLHVAVEFGVVDVINLLLDRGVPVDIRADVDATGVGGQTPIFHAATQFGDRGLPVVQLLVDRGADLSLRVRLPGHYEQADEFVECTPLGYAVRFPGGENRTVAYLRARGAPE